MINMEEEDITLGTIENAAVEETLDQWRESDSKSIMEYLNVIRQLASGVLFLDTTGSTNVGQVDQELKLSGRELRDRGEYLAGFTSQHHIALCYETTETAQSLLQYSFDILQMGIQEPYEGVIINPGDTDGTIWISKAEIEVYFSPLYRGLIEGLKAAIVQSYVTYDPAITLEAFMAQEWLWITTGDNDAETTFVVELDGIEYFPVFTSLPELLYYCGSESKGELVRAKDLYQQAKQFTQGFLINSGGPAFKVPFSDLEKLNYVIS